MIKPRALFSWSGGKDSAWALHLARQSNQFEIAAAMVTLTAGPRRVLLHGVREELLEAQLEAIGLPMVRLEIPHGCPGEVHDAALYRLLGEKKAEGITHVIFGDLFREDVRGYREAQLSHVGLSGHWPLWKQETAGLAREIVGGGVRAYLACVDLKCLAPGMAGRVLDQALLAELPPGVDPCGENGEYHSFVFDGPMFQRPVPVHPGPGFEEDGFAFVDLVLERPGGAGKAPAIAA